MRHALSMVLCLAALSAAGPVPAANPAFRISIDADAWRQFGWQYPVSNSVIHDARQPIEGVQGSSLVQHLAHVAGRRDVWYVANGWLHCYRYVAENAHVARQP